MAVITVRGRFAKSGSIEMSPNKQKPYVSLSLAENLKNANGEREATWYDTTAWNTNAIEQIMETTPEHYVEVVGYATAKAFLRKKTNTVGANIAINVTSVKIIPDDRPKITTTPATLAAAFAATTTSTISNETEETMASF
jgi:hypothetical protein